MYSEYLKSMVADTNQAAQEAGLTAVHAFVDYAPVQLVCVLFLGAWILIHYVGSK